MNRYGLYLGYIQKGQVIAVWQLAAVYLLITVSMIDVARLLHVNEIVPFLAGKSVSKEIVIVDAVIQHREHGYTYGKATYTEKAVYPVSADIPQGSLKVMDEHIENQREPTGWEFQLSVLFTEAVPLQCFRQTG